MPSSLPDASTTGIPLMPANTIIPAACRIDMSGLAVMIEVVMMSEARTFISFMEVIAMRYVTPVTGEQTASLVTVCERQSEFKELDAWVSQRDDV
jgi:hypothetical protein